jgi:hypothetical protein
MNLQKHSCCLEQAATIRFPHTGAFRPSQIVSKMKLPARLLWRPRASLLQRNFSVTAILRLGGDAARDHSSYFLAVTPVAIICYKGKTGCLQLIKVPEVASTTILTKANYKEVIATALDQNSLVLIRKQPYIPAPIGRLIACQSRPLYFLRLNPQ